MYAHILIFYPEAQTLQVISYQSECKYTLQTLAHTNRPEILICKQASVHLNRGAYASASGRIIVKSAGPGCPETVTKRVTSSLKPSTQTPC